MTDLEIKEYAIRFRTAIEAARDAGEFDHQKRNQYEPMVKFPHDCCDDTVVLFIHYLYHEFGEDSMEVIGSYFSEQLGCTCKHYWQMFEGWVVDLTGDQFENDSDIKIKSIPVYVGPRGDFHNQFDIVQSKRSRGIECLGIDSHERMYKLYASIMKHMI